MDILFNSFLLFLGTSLGSIFALFFKRVPLSITLNLAFAGGVMLVASFTSLIIPGIQKGGFLQTSLGIILGFLLIGLLENLFPHEHLVKGTEGIIKIEKAKKIFLIVAGVVIHNIPEGFSVGVSSAYSLEKGSTTAFAIAVQDVPEGLIVTLALLFAYKGFFIPLMVGVVSGLVEALFSFLGYYLFEVFNQVIAFGLGMGGGAMIYITVKEVFPEVYSESSHTKTTLSFLLGFLLMLFLDSLSI